MIDQTERGLPPIHTRSHYDPRVTRPAPGPEVRAVVTLLALALGALACLIVSLL